MEHMKKDGKRDLKWEADCAVDTLIRAEEIKNDPELFAEVQKRLSKKQKAISSIADIKQKANEMDMEEETGEDEKE